MAARLNPSELRGPALCALIAAPLGLLAGLQPAFAIAVAVGIGFVLFALADLSAGLAVFVFLTFMAQIPNLAGPAVSFVKLAGLLLAISWIAAVTSRSDSNPGLFGSHPGLGYALAVFLVLNGLSVLWAEQSSPVLSAVYRYALNAILFLIVFTAVQDGRHLRWVLIAFVAGATVSGLYGIANPPSEAIDAARLSGTLGNANELATVLVAGVALAAGLGAASRSAATRVLALGAAAICLFSLFLTASRGGLVGLAAMLVAAVLISGRHRAKLGVAALIVAIVGVAYFAAIAPPAARQRITEQNGGTGRVDLWTVGKRMVYANPLTGVGAGNFETSSIHYLLEPGALERTDLIVEEPKPVHNTYLEVFAELGLPGGLLFIGIVIASLGYGVRAKNEFRRQGRSALQALATATVLALVGTLASDIFVSDEFSKQLWLLLSLCPALLLIARARPAADGVERPRGQWVPPTPAPTNSS